MAIVLPPRAGAGSVGTGGRRGGPKLPDAGDVRQVRVASDPGLQVPDFSQFAGGLGELGAATFDIGQRMQGRQEGIARDRDDTAFSETLSTTFRGLQADADMADDRVIAQAMAEAEVEEQRIVANHPGGASSKALLAGQLARRRVAFGDQLAVQNIIASRAQRDASVDRRVAGIVADTLSDPSVPIEQRFGQLEDAIKFLDLPPSEARAARADGEEKIGSALINRTISRGEIDENGLLIDARSMLENEELREVLSPAVRGGFVDRIVSIESAVRKAGLNAVAEISALEAVAGRLGLSGEDRQDFILGMLTQGKVSDKQGALNRLVGKGIVDQDTSDKIAAGVFRVVPLRNEFGEVEGAIIVDLTDPSAGNIQVPGQAAPVTVAPPSPAEPQALPAPEEPTAAAAPEEAPVEGAEPLPQDRTLFDIATGDVAVTGVGPAVLEGLQQAFGQVGVNIASAEQLVLRKNFSNAQRRLAVALVPNERFPQKQVEFIIKSADIDLGAFKDRRTLVSSLVSLSSSLRGEEERAAKDGGDTSLPSKVRVAQTGVARAIGNFRESLGVPEGITPEDIEAIGEPSKGGLGAVLEFFKEAVKETTGAKNEPQATVPSVPDIGKMSEDEVRALVEALSPDTRITVEQGRALKKKLGVK